jgi:hypothetical protein
VSPQDDYNYNSSGFDDFLSRSIDNLNQANLDAPGPQSRSLAYDRAQISGSLGDILRIGNIFLDGVNKRIVLSDAVTNRIVLGELPDGEQGFIISKEGEDVLGLLG